jgi:hypothetical protein
LFDASLIPETLIDEFHLLVNPLIMRKEKTIFKDLKENQKLVFIESKVFDNGLLSPHYRASSNIAQNISKLKKI